MFIKDMFFFHEQARKINIWSGFIVLSPYLGPMLAAFIINTQKWQWAFGVYSIETGLCLLAIILFVEETYYDRKTKQPELVPNAPRWKRMLGVQQHQTGYIPNSPWDAAKRPIVMILKPVVFLSTLYYLLTFAWVVGINTTLSIFVGPLYGFGPKQIGEEFLYPAAPSIANHREQASFTSLPWLRLCSASSLATGYTILWRASLLDATRGGLSPSFACLQCTLLFPS